jgi:integrase
LWLILGTLGLRLGEALGRKWLDTDWQHNTITVRRALLRNQVTSSLELAETETSRSRRTLTLPTETARALKAHRNRERPLIMAASTFIPKERSRPDCLSTGHSVAEPEQNGSERPIWAKLPLISFMPSRNFLAFRGRK